MDYNNRIVSVDTIGAKGIVNLFGGDPEVFVLDAKGKPLPAWKYLPSKYEAEEIIHEFGSGGCTSPTKCKFKLFWDGVQAEWTMPAVYCLAWHGDFIHWGLNRILAEARKIDEKAKLTYEDVVKVTEGTWKDARPEHAELGCSPSKNAYGEESVTEGVNGRTLKWRCAGHHLHMSALAGNRAFEGKRTVEGYIKTLDKILGVGLTALLAGLENPLRRTLYGRAGEYRVPGTNRFEYRTPSSAVIVHPAVSMVTKDLSRIITGVYAGGLEKVWDSSEEETREIINNVDIASARKVILRNKDVFSRLMYNIYWFNSRNLNKAMSLFEKGIKEFIDLDVEKNWHLNDGLWRNHSEGSKCNMAKFIDGV